MSGVGGVKWPNVGVPGGRVGGGFLLSCSKTLPQKEALWIRNYRKDY